jgi:hypothetical protein
MRIKNVEVERVMDICQHCGSRKLVWFTPRRFSRPGVVLCRECDRVSVLLSEQRDQSPRAA